MSDQQPPNPPAFPTDSEHLIAPQVWHHEGMTLRDYFAGQAMIGMFAHTANPNAITPTYDRLNGIALDAYMMADKMLRARDTRTTATINPDGSADYTTLANKESAGDGRDAEVHDG